MVAENPSKVRSLGHSWSKLCKYGVNVSYRFRWIPKDKFGSLELLLLVKDNMVIDWIIELYRVLLRSMGSTQFWSITIHLRSVVGATIFKWTPWNISQATAILPSFSLKSIDRVLSFKKHFRIFWHFQLLRDLNLLR